MSVLFSHTPGEPDWVGWGVRGKYTIQVSYDEQNVKTAYLFDHSGGAPMCLGGFVSIPAAAEWVQAFDAERELRA